MSILLLMLAFAASPSSAEERAGAAATRARVGCSVEVHALDARGRERSARRVSAAVAPAVVFRGEVRARPEGGEETPLLFDVFSPRGQRYQVLVAESRTRKSGRGGHRVERAPRVREAALAVAGSSIAWTSMYGTWRVEPRIEGQSRACGKAEYFTIRP
jgi:hypothetical protein